MSVEKPNKLSSRQEKSMDWRKYKIIFISYGAQCDFSQILPCIDNVLSLNIGLNTMTKIIWDSKRASGKKKKTSDYPPANQNDFKIPDFSKKL